MKLLKYAAWTVGTVVVLAVVAIAAALAFIDGSFVKSRLERAMKEKNRTLSIEGEPQLHLFPVASISLGRTNLTEPGSSDTFVALDGAEVSVRVWPLLSGALVVDKLVAHNVRANVRKLKDGRMNFDDLTGPRGSAEPSKGAPAPREERQRELPKLAIGEVDIDRVRVAYTDETTGREVQVQDLTVKLQKLSEERPSPLSMSASITGRNPEVALKVQANGDVRLDLAHRSLTFSKLDARLAGNADKARNLDVRLTGDLLADGQKSELEVNGLELAATGTLDRDALNARFSVPKISVTRDKATGSAVTGMLRLAGPERKVDARLDMAAAEGTATALNLPRVQLAVDAVANGGQLKATVDAPVKGNLAARTWEIPKLVADINLAHPKLGKPVRLPIEASAKADLDKQSVSLNAAANAEDLDFRLQFAAKQLTPLDATFDLSSKRLNLDRYPFLVGALAPPDAKAKPKTDDALDLSALNGRTVNGKIRVGSMQAKNVKLADLAADVKLARGTLAVEPLSANLYEGKLNGSFIASARGNQVTLKQNLQGIQINPLLRDAADKDILEGKGDVSLDVSGAGATVTALKRSLNGNARLVLRDGAYKGINLAEVFRKAQSALGRAPQNAAASGGAQKTDFTELSASFVIKGGVAHNDDLSLKSPFIRAGGSGNLDIAASTLDYTLRPTVVATATGQEGREASGLTVPVHAHGPLDALKYDVDYRGLLTGSVKDRLNQQLNQRLGEALGGKGAEAPKGQAAPSQDPKDVLRDQVRDRLKGILGR